MVVLTLFCVSDGVKNVPSFLQCILESPNDVTNSVIEYLTNIFSFEDVRARAKFRKVRRKLDEFVVEIELYESAVTNRPICNQERIDAINKELTCKEDLLECFDMEKETRFPQTIAFLHELDMWEKRVERHYQQVQKLFEKIEEEAGLTAETAQDAAKASRAKKNQTRNIWTVVGVVFGTIGGVIVTGGAALPVIAAGAGVGALAGVGAGAGTGVIASSDDAQDESTHDELSKRCHKMGEEANELLALVTKFKVFSKSSTLEAQKETVLSHEMGYSKPLLSNLKKPFKIIFDLMNLSIDFNNPSKLKEQIKKIEMR